MFAAGSYLFAPHEEHGFLLLKCGSKPFNQGDAEVECFEAISGEKVLLTAQQTKLAEPTDAQSLGAIEDMVKLVDLKEASILHNLRERFQRDDIYTSIGSILVAVNPFKIVNLYSPDILEAYASQDQDDAGELPPHIFRIADNAYRNVVSLQENQACLVSGESGAGKTEATKILLQFLTEMSARTASEDWGEQGRLQEQILKANPLMEAFGNARTVRNNNSSRFGKYIEVKFNSHLGTITGGSVTQYLLEKSRIVFQSPKERNYHIFYQVVEAAKNDEDFRKRYRISPHQDQHSYLFHANASEGINDDRGWGETCQAMETLSMTPEEIDNLIRTVCSVLQLGNVKFQEKKVANVEQACEVANHQVLDLVAYQLGLDSSLLARALCQKEVRTPNQPSVFQHYTLVQAYDVRDSLAKAVYGMVFDWLIKRINWALDAAAKNAIEGQKMTHNAAVTAMEQTKTKIECSIGVLDIFGFECFEVNSFEQLCINYCNERLQGFFTEHIFKLEQQEYVNEGLALATITFKDNSDIIEMLERKRTGLFAMIDEEGSVPRGSDDSLQSKLYKQFTAHTHFRAKNPKDIASKFGIVHFAGEVQYTVNGFLAKNKDAVPNDVLVLLQESQHRYIRALFPPALETNLPMSKRTGYQTTVAGGAGGKKSLISQFKFQLDQLMETLGDTQPHFIRCVKPNKLQRGAMFDGQMVLEQLRYAGLLEVCRIRKQGFPVRRDHAYCMWRFGVILGKGADAAAGRKDIHALCECLVARNQLAKHDHVIGQTKLFLKSEAFDKLERLRGQAVDTSATTIQAVIRGKLARLGIAKAKQLVAALKLATANRDVPTVEALLLNSALLPNQGRHLEAVKLARKMMQQIEEERRVEHLVEEALQSNEVHSLLTAIQAAKDLKYQSPTVTKAVGALAELQRQNQVLSSLQIAIRHRDLENLRAALRNIDFVTTSQFVAQGNALVLRLQEEASLVAKIRAAIGTGNVTLIQHEIDSMVSFGMGSHALVLEAMQITKEQSAALAKFQGIVNALRLEALAAERDVKKLQRVQQSTLELGIGRGVSKEIDQAMDLLAELEHVDSQRRILQNARKALGVKATRTNGLSGKEDLEDLRQAMRDSHLDAEDEEMKETVDCLDRAERQLAVQSVLLSLVGSRDLDKLKLALEQCQGLEINTVDVYIKVREAILDLESTKKKQVAPPAAATAASTRADLELDEDQLERKNKEKLRNAIAPGFYYGNYFRLRSDADFAKGIMFNKNKPITAKLTHQSDPLHKSLLELPADLSRSATRLNRNILGYCGDVMMSFPASLAQDLVDKCLSNPALVDEIYLQLCKQASLNPEPQSLGRVWQLFCICVGCFPPTPEFEPYLLNFLLKSYQKGSIIGQYARYALRTLQSTVSFGPSAETVSIDEIIAYGDRPPVMATIQLIDGTKITKDFPIPPNMNVDDALRICSEFLSLDDTHSEWFGMFVKETPLKKRAVGKENVDAFFSSQSASAMHDKQQQAAMPDGLEIDLPPPPPPMDDDEDDIPPRTAYPLESTQHMGDVVLAMVRSQMTETFVFKRKFFLPNRLDLGVADSSPVYNRLMYLQILDEVLTGMWHASKIQDAIELCSIAFAVDLGDSMPDTVQGVLDEGLMEYVPEGRWRYEHTEEEWAKLVLAKRDVLIRTEVEDLELLFMQTAEQVLPTFGSCAFYIRMQWGGSDYLAFVDYNGIRITTLKTREVVHDLRYREVRKITSTSRVLTFDMKDSSSVRVFTSQAKEIAGLMQDYRNLLSLIPEEEEGEDGDIMPAAAPIKKKFFTPHRASVTSNSQQQRKSMLIGSRTSQTFSSLPLSKPQRNDMFAPPTTGRDRITSVSRMKPSAGNATLEAAKKKVF